MSLDTVTLDEALRLLALPRVVGTAPTARRSLARNGRYGPYVQKGKETRSLEREEQVFTITLDEALALLAQPKRRAAAAPRSRRCASSARTRSTGKPVVLKEGRFGPYVTDGETNASLRAGRFRRVGHHRARVRAARRAPRRKGPATKRRTAKRKKS